MFGLVRIIIKRDSVATNLAILSLWRPKPQLVRFWQKILILEIKRNLSCPKTLLKDVAMECLMKFSQVVASIQPIKALL